MKSMKLSFSMFLIIVMCLFFGNAMAGVVTTDGADIVVKTKGGLEVKTTDKKYSFKLGGRIQWDTDFYDGIYNVSDDGDRGSDSELRRARVYVSGTVYHDWKYKLQLDINQDKKEIQFKDAYITYAGLDFMDITVGRFKLPFALEEATSSKWISTIERSILWEFAETSHQDFGIKFNGYGAGLSWAVSVTESDEDEDDEDQYGIGARLTYAPIREKDHVLHLGAAYFVRNADDNFGYNAASRFGVHTADKTTIIDDDFEDQNQWGLELAYMYGPFSIQGEYIQVNLDDGTFDNDIDVSGYYVQGTFTLTGESRGYKWKKGAFDKIKPKGKYGAVELVARAEMVDVDFGSGIDVDPDIDVYTLGLNWYFNENVKLAIDYVKAETGDIFIGEDDGDAITTRLQFVF